MTDRGPPPTFTGRPNSMNMFGTPQTMNPALHHQQLQQSQQDSHQGMPFSDPSRMWPMQGPQDQFRQQQGNAMNNQHLNNQMVDMLRNQPNMNRMAQAGGADFTGVGPSHPMGMQGSHQQFHDQQGAQQHAHMPSMGFQSSPAGPHNPVHGGTFDNRAAMMNAVGGNPINNANHARQLELMSLAQNQQNQNGPIPVNRMMPPGHMQPHSNGNQAGMAGGEFFPNGMAGEATMRRNSPHPPHPPHNNQMGQNPVNPNMARGTPPPGAAGARPQVTTVEIMGRMTQAREALIHTESQMKQLQANRAGVSDAEFLAKSRQLQQEYFTRKEMLARLQNAWKSLQVNGGQMGPAGRPPGPNAPPFPSQMPPQSPYMNGNGAAQPPPAHSPPLASPPQRNAQTTPMMPTNQPPPRSIPTPQQMPKANLPQQASPSMGPQFTGGTQGHAEGAQRGPLPATNIILMLAQNATPAQPLDKSRFDAMLPSFLNQRGIPLNPADLSIEGKMIDLHALHAVMISMGGVQKIETQDLWAVVAGRIGFVNFPGELPKSGPATATRISQVYKSYLIQFDHYYLQSVFESRRKMAAAGMAQQGNLPMANRPGQQSLGGKPFDPAAASRLIAYADASVAELKAKGVPEEQINFIEMHRQSLKQMASDQNIMQQVVRNRAMGSGGPSDQHGSQPPAPMGAQPQPQPPMGNLPNAAPGTMQPGSAPALGTNAVDNRNGLVGPFGKISRENYQHASNFLQRFQTEFQRDRLPTMRPADVPPEARATHMAMLDQANQTANELMSKLPMLLMTAQLHVEQIRRVVWISMACQHQKKMLSVNTPPRYICSVENLRSMIANIKDTHTRWTPQLQQLANLMKQHQLQNGAGPSQLTPQMTGPNAPLAHGPNSQQAGQQPAMRPPPAVNSAMPPPQQIPPAQGSPAMRKPSELVSQASPAAAATPVASASTPANASSPQTPKSPRGKAPAKPKAAPKRKASKAGNTPAGDGTTPTSAPSPTIGTKRPRQDDAAPTPVPPTPEAHIAPTPAAPVADEPSPPKKPKTEWEGPPSEEVVQKQKDVESIYTDDDATEFFEKMTEIFKTAGDGPGGLVSNMAAEFSTILKGVGAPLDMPEASTSSATLDAKREPSPQPTVEDSDFAQFFDFSSFGDDNASKAPTPDLVSSTSTNPSPGSSDSDAHQHANGEVKSEDLSDPTRLGAMKEIDGGEAAYFTTTDWKWEGTMPQLDQPWAIYTSS